MLFIINKDFIEDRNIDPYFYEFLDILMLAYQEGNHLVVMRPALASCLIGDNKVYDKTKKILMHYYNHTAKQANNYLNYFNVSVEIISSLKQRSCYSDIDTRNEFRQMKSSDFIKSVNIQHTILLGENNTDSIVYKMFGQYFLDKNRINSLYINCSNQAGGGSTTHQSYQEIYEANDRFCLCILDSDKKTPDSSIGNTAKKVVIFHEKGGNTNLRCSWLISEKVLEIENLLPSQFYLDEFVDDVNKSNIYKSLKDLEGIACNFFDFKNGVKCIRLHNDLAYAEFWNGLLKINCDDNCEYEFEDKDCCSIKAIKGYGAKVLDQFVIYASKNNLVNVFDNEDDFFSEEWTKMGSQIASFCCGDNAKRAI